MEQLSKDEMRRFLHAAKDATNVPAWFHLALKVGFYHGLRVSEIVGLMADNFQDGNLVVQRCKGSKKTVQPLISSDDPVLDERQAMIDYLVHQPFNQPLFKCSTRHFMRLVDKVGALAGLPKHKRITKILKQTCGRQLCETMPINYVQTWLGHVKLSSTGAYTRVSDEEAAEKSVPALSL